MPLSVEKIKNGTVIDHIEAGRGLHVMSLLGVSFGYEGILALVMNVPSKSMGRKDILKIDGKRVDQKDVDKISVVAPRATFNIITDSNVVEKRKVSLPERLLAAFKCPNPKCVTNSEKVETCFSVEKGPRMRCGHCERLFPPAELFPC